jgi:hypothetical protein
LCKETEILYLKLNITHMKRKLLFGVSFVFLAWAATSCKTLTDCQTCKLVTRKTSDNSIVNEGGGTEYCGVALTAAKVANPDVPNTVNGTITKFECN